MLKTSVHCYCGATMRWAYGRVDVRYDKVVMVVEFARQMLSVVMNANGCSTLMGCDQLHISPTSWLRGQGWRMAFDSRRINNRSWRGRAAKVATDPTLNIKLQSAEEHTGWEHKVRACTTYGIRDAKVRTSGSLHLMPHLYI